MTDQTTNGTLRAFDTEFVFDNPFQHPGTRRTSGPEFEQFVEDVRANGVRTPPPARLHPDVSGAVQLREGHRRFAAHKIAFPGQPFVVLVQTISDADMLDDCIRENVFRADWNDIEVAEMMETYLRVHPKATNAELARKFNYKNPASIPNVRKLLRLPAAIQAHVITNALPDAIARALVGVSAVNPKAALKIADEVAAAPKSEKQDTFENLAREIYWRNMVSLDNVWSLDWLEDAPVTVERDLGDGEHVITACAGCVFNVNDHCARKPCYEEKHKLWSAAEVQRVAESKKLVAAGPDEKTYTLFKGEYHDDDRAQELLNARKEIRGLLRVAPLGGTNAHNYLSRMLGSRAVTLVTTDKTAIDKFFEERSAAAKSKRSASAALSIDKETETDAERAARVERERKEMEAKRAARAQMWKSYFDGLWVLEHAALEIGAALVKQHRGPFVGFIAWEFFRNHRAVLGAEEIEKRFRAEFKSAGDETMRQQWQLSLVALRVLAQECIDPYFRAANNERETNYRKVCKIVESFCAGDNRDNEHPGFGVTLSDGWNVPPVHNTEFNCWLCSRFAGNTSEKLTQRDKSEGWLYYGSDGVFCSQEHANEFAHAQRENAGVRENKKHAKTNSAANKPKRKASKK